VIGGPYPQSGPNSGGPIWWSHRDPGFADDGWYPGHRWYRDDAWRRHKGRHDDDHWRRHKKRHDDDHWRRHKKRHDDDRWSDSWWEDGYHAHRHHSRGPDF
jgi:hypothetical protein